MERREVGGGWVGGWEIEGLAEGRISGIGEEGEGEKKRRE